MGYLAGISALLAAGCAKEKPYDVVYKGENKVFAKTEKIARRQDIKQFMYRS